MNIRHRKDAVISISDKKGADFACAPFIFSPQWDDFTKNCRKFAFVY